MIKDTCTIINYHIQYLILDAQRRFGNINKMLFCFFVYLIDSIRIIEIEIIVTCMLPCNIHNQIKLQFPLFLATVLTNKLVILTILFLQCGCSSYRGLFDSRTYQWEGLAQTQTSHMSIEYLLLYYYKE